MTDSANTFEQSMAELEQLVSQLEQGDLPLDQALTHFERGIQLTRQCQQELEQAEQRVKVLLAEQPSDPAAQ
jgi:exodeoxyribonuclease VII small subunit